MAPECFVTADTAQRVRFAHHFVSSHSNPATHNFILKHTFTQVGSLNRFNASNELVRKALECLTAIEHEGELGCVAVFH